MKLCSEIASFKQTAKQNLYYAWERFKSFLEDYPHHQQSNEVLTHTFVKGLDHNTKILLDSTADGQALELTYDEVYTLLNQIAQGNLEWHSNSINATKKVVGVLEVD